MNGRHSHVGLDWVNFFVANLQTAFGPFISVYLIGEAWTQGQVGLVLSIGTAASMASQVPAGALVDAVRNKRVAAGAAILALIAGALILAIWPARLPVALAEVLHGFASCVLSPAIGALTLAVVGVGTAALGERLGRNARFGAIGNGFAAALMGAVGYYVSARAVFWVAAMLAVPGLGALRLIRTARLDVTGLDVTGRAPGQERERIGRLFTDRRLLSFGLCVACFHLANAALLPLAAGEVSERAGGEAELIIAACIMVPQAVVALLSPMVGRAAERFGRRPVLLAGFAALPLRGVLFALVGDPRLLVVIQGLDGVSASVFGVLLPLVAADLTRGTGRFNLCMGVLGLWIGAAATLSTGIGGLLADRSLPLAFLGLAGAGLLGTMLVWTLMPETRHVAAETRILP
ncbi:MAG TPA: MFS transporter [Acetobacteraceae bacterium]|nr:MFS transporter [Acetobacteraceae bacterium]